MTRHLGNLLAEHHAETRAMAKLAEERRREPVIAAERRETIVRVIGPGPEPDSMDVEYADGSCATCFNWSKRPRGYGEARK